MSDIFKFFEKMNHERFEYVDELSDDDIKKLNAFMLLQWVNGSKSNSVAHVMLTDEFVNDRVFSLYQHPRLLLKLLIAANGGMGNTRYGFDKSVTSEKEKEIKQIASYYKVGYNTAKQYSRILSEEDIKTIKEFYT